MTELTRRDVLRKSGIGAVTTGTALGVVGTAAASSCDPSQCETGECSSYCGDVLKVHELNGNGTASYEITAYGGAIYDCFPDTTDSDNYAIFGDGSYTVGGTISDDTDKFLLSGSGIHGVRVCDVDDPGAQFTIEVEFCPEHCAYGFNGYTEIGCSNLTGAGNTEPLCASYGSGEASYHFCTTGDVEELGDIEPGEGDEGFCGEGTLPDGDDDYYSAYGRLQYLSVEPSGSNVYISRDAPDNC